MSPRTLLRGALVLIAGLFLSPALSLAASHLLHYDLTWNPDGSVSVRTPSGHASNIQAGQSITIKQGTEILTLSLQNAALQAADPGPVARALLKIINTERAAHGAPALSLSVKQSTCSAAHSRHMASMGHISHDQFPSDLCVAYDVAGENVGEASGTPDAAVTFIHQAMMNEGPCPRSPCSASALETHGHYLNLMNPMYRIVGIGIVTAGGTTWLTEDFVA